MGDDLEESNKKSTAKETVHLSWKRWKDWMIEKLGDVEFWEKNGKRKDRFEKLGDVEFWRKNRKRKDCFWKLDDEK